MSSRDISRLATYFRSIDKYAFPITLRHKGEPLFRTWLGATLTIIQYTLLAAFLIAQLVSVHNRDQISINTSVQSSAEIDPNFSG